MHAICQIILLLQLCGHALEQADKQLSWQPAASIAHEGTQLGGTAAAAAPACSPPQAASAEHAEISPGAAILHSCTSHTAQAASDSASTAVAPVRERREGQALGKAAPGGKREECEGPRIEAQCADWPVLIDFGAVGCMGLLGSASALLKRLRTALELAGLQAVLLTGAARRAIVRRQCCASLTLTVKVQYAQNKPP